MLVPGSPPSRIIGIGASAGGLAALIEVMEVLPADLPHAVCVVLHVAPKGRSVLPQILDRRCRLEVVSAEQGEPVGAGHAYVAPPDHHLEIHNGEIVLTSGPPENGVRPAVDTMLRSLAAARGPGAVAVVLSGALGDGSVGARLVAEAGGSVFIQDPAEALVPSMPLRALAMVPHDAQILSARRIGCALAELDAPPCPPAALAGTVDGSAE